MVDFEKLLGKEQIVESDEPIKIFEYLDKEAGKEYLRPSQKDILEQWYKKFQNQQDTIIKLQTGLGKTLIGLLILKSTLNTGTGPALYICPNNYLVSQTVEQADKFGIKVVKTDDYSSKLPREFLNSEAILVTNCNKLFNGKSQFGVTGSHKDCTHVGAIVIDDAHKCLDIIRESFSILVNRGKPTGEKNKLFDEFLLLFSESLENQAPGTYLEIKNQGLDDSIMAVPFWTWYDKRKEVLSLLQEHREDKEILFVWDLLKNRIEQCMCIFSGGRMEISPRLLPLDLLPSFTRSPRRIFLSATLTEDAFLVKDFGINPKSISNPITSKEIKYSGERLILMPTLVNSNLKREHLIKWISKLAEQQGSFGIVSIVPSFHHAEDWISSGGIKTSVNELQWGIDKLKGNIIKNNAKKVLILVNEYDGVDLPDSTCRILCLDSLPTYNLLVDKYSREVRLNSKVIRRKLAQRVEQGIGRAIRGSNDWCIVIIVGNNISDFLSENVKRAYLSEEAQTQIKIGEELASELQAGVKSISEIEKLIFQCLSRDAGWKEYYKEKMDKIKLRESNYEYLNRAVLERKAEILYQQNHIPKAIETIQTIITESDEGDKGWLLQQMATYQYPESRKKAMDIQLKAHTENIGLFRPKITSYSKITSSGNRVSRILEYIQKHDSHGSLQILVENILGKIKFDNKSETFEDGIEELGQLLGFVSDRPEKKTGRGPDNLWQIDNKNYWIIECKNMVSSGRGEISKFETGQISNSIGWFKEKFENSNSISVIIHPGNILSRDAYVNEPLYIMQSDSLEKLKQQVTSFYKSLGDTHYDNINSDIIKKKIVDSKIDTGDLMKQYLKRVKDNKGKKIL